MSQFSERDLEGIVGEALAAERDVPAEWRDAARAAYAWRSVDQELLALTYDSRLDTAAAVRGNDDARTLEFSAGALTLEVELSGGRVVGRLTSQVTGEVTLESADGSRRSAAPDDSGFFSLEGTVRGPVRFAVQAGESRLVTEWVVL